MAYYMIYVRVLMSFYFPPWAEDCAKKPEIEVFIATQNRPVKWTMCRVSR